MFFKLVNSEALEVRFECERFPPPEKKKEKGSNIFGVARFFPEKLTKATKEREGF